MSLWIFQSIVNLLLINTALFWILSRKRTKFLEAQLDRVEREIEMLKSRGHVLEQAKNTAPQTAQRSSSNEPLVSTGSSSPAKTPASQPSVVGTSTHPSPSAEKIQQSHRALMSPLESTSLGADPALRAAPAPSSPASSLVEKQNPATSLKTPSQETFERASMMLSSGVNVKEISRLTGLSLAELQLMNKVATRSH